MSIEQSSNLITICSDSIGDTAEAVVQAVIHQFQNQQITIKRYGNIRHEDELRKLMEEAAQHKGFVVYTLVQPELREMIKEEAVRLDLRIVDIMGPMMQAFIDTFDDAPQQRPGLLHQLDENYFRRMEAIEFTVACDDGRDLGAMLKADIVLLGMSRTSKTPLSIFLAHRGKKVVNYPIIPEIAPPKELLSLPSNRLIGLTMKPEYMLKIRSERLKALGLPTGSQYASLERITEEMEYASSLFNKLGCPVIDITDKAIEETAGIIMGYI
ncbi:pyruvate, water dikinase regulatory protein [Paenibacillus sp. FSL F4-0236]|uniref:pyruvate, water dikinase regulatory protein n=1 Tax=Paenibacillus sp. FSL F4-0236 TaxID=2954731 RepID=UPI004048601A